MKPHTTDRHVESTLTGTEIKMTVDLENMAEITGILRNLYKDPEGAVLREYSCNASDANRDAGHNRPIRVSLPSGFNPVLVISDEGPGMSEEDIRLIFSKYGASTKTDSNEFTGRFGVGCKSALTYTDQFTVESIKDGKKIVLSVSLEEGGSGTMRVVYSGPTDEPSGTKVTVPTHRRDTFAAKAVELFQWWPKGSVLVDGREPARFEAEHVIDDIYFQTSNGRYYDQQKPSVVVMGNVPYTVKLDDLGLEFGSNEKARVIAFLPTGSVEPLATRETLRMTVATQRALLAIGEKIKSNAVAKVQSDIEGQPDKLSAVTEALRLKAITPRIFQPDSWTYKGEDIPFKYDSKVSVEDTGRTDKWGQAVRQRKGGFILLNTNHYSALKDFSRRDQLGAETLMNATFFFGFDVEFTGNHRRRLDIWMENHPDVPNKPNYILMKDKIDLPWIDPTWHDWEEVRQTKLPTNSHSEYGRLLGSYDAYEPGVTHPGRVAQVQAANIDTSLPIYYYAANERTSRFDRTRARLAQCWVQNMAHHHDCTVVLLPETRLPKLLRQFPGAQDLITAVRARFNTWQSTVTDAQKLAIAMVNNQDDAVKNLDWRQIDDPEIVKAIEASTVDISGVRKLQASYQELGLEITLPTYTDPLIPYPLVNKYNIEQYTDHTIVYLNAAYWEFRRATPTRKVN